MSKRIVEEISPPVLGADLMRLGEEIKMAESLGIHWLHLDNMDGHFAPNISFGPDFVRAIRRQTNLFLDTHLMLSRPMQYIEAYAKAGADLITRLPCGGGGGQLRRNAGGHPRAGRSRGREHRARKRRSARLSRCCRCATSCW